MVTQWRAMPTMLWSLQGAAAWVLHGIAFLGWGIVLLSTFLIDHFDLFGLRQTWLAFRGVPYTQKPFVERGLYRHVRHPLMLGFLIAFWATPVMTVSHLVFAGGFSVYILGALFIEENTLVAMHGNAYREYQRRVPKLIRVWLSH
jgi:protein-S-isoprenylcysteine O-methyltransferase Ste14